MVKIKNKRVWIYLPEEDQKMLEEVSAGCGPLRETDILGVLVNAALLAVKKRGSLELPLKLEVASKKARKVSGGGVSTGKDSPPKLSICSL